MKRVPITQQERRWTFEEAIRFIMWRLRTIELHAQAMDLQIKLDEAWEDSLEAAMHCQANNIIPFKHRTQVPRSRT